MRVPGDPLPSLINSVLTLLYRPSPAALFYGLIRLVQMLRACERGDIFSLCVSTHLQAFSLALRALLGRANTEFGLMATGEQLWSLLMAALFLVLAQILKEAASVAEDSASIV